MLDLISISGFENLKQDTEPEKFLVCHSYLKKVPYEDFVESEKPVNSEFIEIINFDIYYSENLSEKQIQLLEEYQLSFSKVFKTEKMIKTDNFTESIEQIISNIKSRVYPENWVVPVRIQTKLLIDESNFKTVQEMLYTRLKTEGILDFCEVSSALEKFKYEKVDQLVDFLSEKYGISKSIISEEDPIQLSHIYRQYLSSK